MAQVLIGLLGDKKEGYLPHEAAEKALTEMLDTIDFGLAFEWIPTAEVSETLLEKYDCIWAGSGPYLHEENALAAIKFARENNIPIIGTCSGFKYMVIEYAKHVFKAEKPFDYIGRNQLCTTDYKDLAINLKEDCSLVSVYEANQISEISHCTFEIAPNIFDKTSRAFEFCGVAEDGRTVLIRLPNHPFYAASLFLPQLKSDSKLIKAWLKAALKLKEDSLVS